MVFGGGPKTPFVLTIAALMSQRRIFQQEQSANAQWAKTVMQSTWMRK